MLEKNEYMKTKRRKMGKQMLRRERERERERENKKKNEQKTM